MNTIEAPEVLKESLPRQAAGFICVSQSGETKDTHRALQVAINADIPAISVVNQVGSLIARTTNCGVYVLFFDVLFLFLGFLF